MAHITREMFLSWQSDSLTESEQAEFFEHMAGCTFCAEQFAEWMEEVQAVTEPPVYLAEEILERTRQIDIRTAVKVKQASRQVQLLLYSIKVGLAVAASIFVLIVTAGVQNTGISENLYKEEMQDTGKEQKTEETVQDRETGQKVQDRETGQTKEKALEDSIIEHLNQKSRGMAEWLNGLTDGFFRKN